MNNQSWPPSTIPTLMATVDPETYGHQSRGISRMIGKLRTRLSRKTADPSLRQSLTDVMAGHDADPNGVIIADDLGDAERIMLRNVLDYGELKVEDVAVPRADITGFDVEEGFDDLVKLFADAVHSRMPVYRDTLDGIIGMVHIKDVFVYLADTTRPRPKVEQLLRSVLFVPPSMRVMDLLARMRASHIHIAIVVDEYGGTDGLVTIEDLVEQIVGDIKDEHDDAQTRLLRDLGGGHYDADARLPITELEVALGISLIAADSDDDIDTLGGLIFVLAGHVPVIGEAIEHPAGIHFEIVDGDPRRITRVRLQYRPMMRTEKPGDINEILR